MPRCTELAAVRAEREQEFVPLRKEACRAFADQDEAALFASYAEMFKKSEAMLSEFPARQECRTASGDMDTFDLANREDAEGYIRMGVQESYQLLRPRMIAVCPSTPSAEARPRIALLRKTRS